MTLKAKTVENLGASQRAAFPSSSNAILLALHISKIIKKKQEQKY